MQETETVPIQQEELLSLLKELCFVVVLIAANDTTDIFHILFLYFLIEFARRAGPGATGSRWRG